MKGIKRTAAFALAVVLAVCAAAAVRAGEYADGGASVKFYRDSAHTEEIAASEIAVGDVVYYAVIPDVSRAVTEVRTNLAGPRSPHIVDGGAGVDTSAFVASVPGDEIVFGTKTALAGDVDGDGELTAKDVSVLLKAFVGDTGLYWQYVGYNPAADIYSDGKYDLKDAVTLMQYLAGWKKALPCRGEAKMFTLTHELTFDVIACTNDSVWETRTGLYVSDYDSFCGAAQDAGIDLPSWFDREKYGSYRDVRVYTLCGTDTADGLKFVYSIGPGIPGLGPEYEVTDESKSVTVAVGLY